MRAALLFSTIVAGGVLVAPSTATADLPAYTDLPSGHVTSPPETTPPAFIPANEKVPGFFVARPSFPKRMKGMKGASGPGYVMVVPTAERAKKIESGDLGGTRGDEETGPCFSQSRRLGGSMRKRPAEAEGDEGGETGEPPVPDWNEGLAGVANIHVKTENNPNAGVTAVHRERVVTDASGTRLEMDDVWVDPATKGVRKIGSATLPLKRLASSRGLEIWAARDERDPKTKAVHFVVVPPRGLPNGPESLVGVHGDGRNTSSNSCSHLRVAMNAADGAADSAVLKATLTLPDLQREGVPRGEDEEEKRARVREASVQLGVSKTKRDKQPIVSVTFGWSGRETMQVVRSDERE